MICSGTNVTAEDFEWVRNVHRGIIGNSFYLTFAKKFPDAYIDAGSPHNEPDSFPILE